ncbi:MAG: hypothetical protein ACXAC8_06405 [Candidatus Hodarchaeales archaeon]
MNKYLATDEQKNLSYSRLKAFRSIQRKKAIISTTTYALIWISLTIVLSVLLQVHESPIRNFIYALVLAAVIIYWFVSIPFLGILGIITIQTRSRDYLFQFIPNLGLLIVMTLASLINYIEFKEDLFTVAFIGILLLIIILESIFLRLVMREVKENKKPIFLWTFFQDSFEAYSSTILTQQALLIEEEQNGYSERPFFANFSELTRYCTTPFEFTSKFESYARFLTEKREVIGWNISENSVTLYPRVLLGEADYGLGLFYLWNLLIKVIKKKGLTSITINYNSQELSLKIAKEDYNLLNDVTYHLLGQQVLERFKKSMIMFMEDDLDKSYSLLFPFTS